MKNKMQERIVYFGLVLLACLLVFLVSPFSPIYRYLFEADEICYQNVAWGWMHGKIPYRDIFDHKGPLTYLFYMLGLFLGGGQNWGIMIVFMIIHAANFVLIFRTLKLIVPFESACVGTLLLLALFFAQCNSLFASASKPDHIILLWLLIAEYIYVRGIKRYASEKTSSKSVFSSKEMLLMGLCCGAVFMIKLNACIYFFVFVGAYFLWLLTRRSWKSFFSSCGSFLLGIAAISVPFCLYFASQSALRDFLNGYFVFNSKYAKRGGVHLLFSRPYVDQKNTYVIIILLFLMLVGALWMTRKTRTNHLQQFFLLICGAISYAVMVFPEVFPYSFVVLIPIYLIGCGCFVAFISERISGKAVCISLSLLSLLIFAFFSIRQMTVSPPIPFAKNELEVKMNGYYDTHPDSQCLYLGCLCSQYLYKESPSLLEYKYFYMPRESDYVEIMNEQFEYVRQGLPDVIAYRRTSDIDDKGMERIEEFIEESGYMLYYDDYDYTRMYIFVRNMQEDGQE